jgi:hypothetical protein
LERLKLFAERSDTHHKELLSKYMGQEAFIREQQMAVQHKLDDQDPNQNKLEGLKSNNLRQNLFFTLFIFILF